MLVPPVSYQGGKQRIADQILDIIKPSGIFHDCCCGSGSVSIALINRGYDPAKIFMIDRGPWGLVWSLVGNGLFNMDKFAAICGDIPKDPRKIKGYMECLSKQSARISTPYVYLLLQAASFGGKAIWIARKEDEWRWQNCSFRSYWEPTATSNRRSHVNPMMPMPETMLDRMAEICVKMKGINGIFGDVQEYMPETGIVYVDPPYTATTRYVGAFDVVAYAKSLSVPCYISEGKPLSEKAHLISSGRAKGGISGERKKQANEEWLSEM